MPNEPERGYLFSQCRCCRHRIPCYSQVWAAFTEPGCYEVGTTAEDKAEDKRIRESSRVWESQFTN